MGRGLRSRSFRGAIIRVGVALLCVLGPRAALADRILVEPNPRDRGYIPIEELSHEILIEPSEGFDALMRVRTALYNASNTTEDFVHLIALPADAELIGVRTARDGIWSEDEVVHSGDGVQAPRRLDEVGVADFTAFATSLETRGTKLAAAKVFGWGIESGETVQVELLVRVRPTLRGSRWTVDLPRRGTQQVIHDRRGVLVRNPTGSGKFWVDNQMYERAVVDTRGADGATIAWTANLGRGRGLLGQAEAVPNLPADGAGGTLRLYLQAGTMPHRTPDHLSFLFDASSSVRSDLRSDALRVARHLLSSRHDEFTVDALAFHREVVPLLPTPVLASSALNLDASFRRAGLLDAPPRAGTNIVAALQSALRRVPEGSKIPTLVVFSDGMFPRVADAPINELLALIQRASQPPQIVLVIDDPLLARTGLGARHPASEFAAQIGARIRSIELNTLDSYDIEGILSAPRVVGDIRVRSTNTIKFGEYPTDLIGGNIEIVEGTYRTAKPPKSITVRALSGRTRMRAKVPVRTVPRRGRAFVSTADEIQRDGLAESLQAPRWYRESMEEAFRAELGRASFNAHDRVGMLSQELMSLYLRRRVLPLVRACYNEALKRDGTIGGRVIMSYQIAKGEVMMASVSTRSLTTADPVFDQCLERAAWKLEVPAGRLDTQRYDVRYPVQLTPPEGGKAPSLDSELSPLVKMMLSGAEILAR